MAKNCKQLKDINIGGLDDITDNGFKFLIENNKQLESMNLKDHDLMSDARLKILSENCPNLKYLSLQNCTSSNLTLRGLRDNLIIACMKLKELNLANCNLTIPSNYIHQMKHINSELEILFEEDQMYHFLNSSSADDFEACKDANCTVEKQNGE